MNWNFFKINLIDLVNKYNRINIKKINHSVDLDRLPNFNNKLLVILDIRLLKSKIFIINKNKCFLSLTPGIIFNKLNMKEKKSKKSEKLIYLMIKSAFLKAKTEIKFRRVVVYIKGLKKYLNNIISSVTKNLINKRVLFIFSNKISHNKLKFKKIRSIKKRLKKKNVKLK